MTRSMRALGFLGCLTLAVWASGCAETRSHIKLTYWPDGLTATSFETEVPGCVFRKAENGNLDIAGRVTEPNGEQRLIHLHLYWKPVPSKTFDHSSSVDAVIRYAIVTPTGAAVFKGCGYVYPQERRFAEGMIARVESGQLKMTDQVGDAPPEDAGPTGIAGDLLAREDAAAAMRIVREIDMLAPADAQGN